MIWVAIGFIVILGGVLAILLRSLSEGEDSDYDIVNTPIKQEDKDEL